MKSLILSANNQVAVNKPDFLVKVPDAMYQVFFELAQGSHASLQEKQKSILDQVKDWVANNYPGYGIASFDDFSRDEADTLKRKTGYDITWGMWLVLSYGTDIERVSLSEKLLSEPMKQIGK